MESSQFSQQKEVFRTAERLDVRGGTCDCYKVKLYGKWHFLKQLKPEFNTNPRYVAALRKEFETGYNLDHPNLVRYIASGDDYLLTEFVDGVTLKEFADRNPDFFNNKTNANRLIGELLDVLEYLHSHQIVHLDLKPDNIIITRVGNELKLTDLGFCYTDTFTDTTGCTNHFAAPEQLNSKGEVDERTDIYAVGKILEILPFSTLYSNIIARCTKPLKEDRYQNVEDIRQDLNKRRHRKWSLTVVLAAIGCLLVFTAWLLMQKNGSNIKSEATLPIANNTAIVSNQHTDTTQSKASNDNNISLPVTVIQNSKSVSSRIEAPVVSATPATVATPTPIPVKKEISLGILRAEMMSVARPCYNRHLKPYESYRFSQIEDQYNKILNKCYDDFTPILIDMWDTKYKQYTNLTQRQYYNEIGKIRAEFDHTLYTKLQTNEANASKNDDN